MPHSHFWVLRRRGRNKRRRGGGRTEYGNISFIQANVQHSIAASGILIRTVSVERADVALVQEPWYREDSIRDLTVPGYTLYSAGGKERPRTCMFARKTNAWVMPDLSCRDLVAILMKNIEDGAERRPVSALPICRMIPRILPRHDRWRNSCDTVRKRTYVCSATPMHIILHGAAPTAMGGGVPA